MKLSAKTFNVLKNFSTINPSILIKEGSTLSTISPTKTILAKATVPDVFPCNVAIYDLSRFIRSVSLFENPDFDFGEKSVTIRDELRSIVYDVAADWGAQHGRRRGLVGTGFHMHAEFLHQRFGLHHHIQKM